MDFNNDSVTGNPNTIIESEGSIALQKDLSGMGWVELTDGTLIDITYDGQRVGDGTYQDWSLVAAETINGQNKVIWTHQDGRMSEWNVDENWNYSSHNTHSAGSKGFFDAESSFLMDFNNDSIIGDPLG